MGLRLHTISGIIDCQLCYKNMTSRHAAMIYEYIVTAREVKAISGQRRALYDAAIEKGQMSIEEPSDYFLEKMNINSRRFSLLHNFIKRSHKGA